MRYQAYLTAGVERWREYRDQLAPLGKKPILFVMMNSTAEADDVGDWLRDEVPRGVRRRQDCSIIHTDRSGEVSQEGSRHRRGRSPGEVDDGSSPVNAIVSVLMLREGWDVQNVTVIVGLRPYTAKANILPEQTIGRGLRLMFRRPARPTPSGSTSSATQRSSKFVEQLENDEDLTLDTFDLARSRWSSRPSRLTRTRPTTTSAFPC